MRDAGETIEWWAVAGRALRRMARSGGLMVIDPPLARVCAYDAPEPLWSGPALLATALARAGLIEAAGEAGRATLWRLSARGRGVVAAGIDAERAMRAEIARLRERVAMLRDVEDTQAVGAAAAPDEIDALIARVLGPAAVDAFAPTQRRIVAALVAAPDRMINCEQIAAALGRGGTSDNAIKVHLSNIRATWKARGFPGAIVTRWGLGYAFSPSAAAGDVGAKRRAIDILRPLLEASAGAWIARGALSAALWGGDEPTSGVAVLRQQVARTVAAMRADHAGAAVEWRGDSLRITGLRPPADRPSTRD